VTFRYLRSDFLFSKRKVTGGLGIARIGVTTVNLAVLPALAPWASVKIVHLMTDHGKGGEKRELLPVTTRTPLNHYLRFLAPISAHGLVSHRT